MKKKIKLGIVCLTRNTFDFNAAADIYGGILDGLRKRDDIALAAIENVIMNCDEAVNVGQKFASEQVDAVVMISGTFHLGHLALEIKKWCDKPILLWGLPELPYNGGKIRLNSVCGVNLNASNLTKSGYTDFTYQVSDSIDEQWLDAVRMIAALKQATVGVLGYRADGFFNVGVDELALYRKYGCIINHFELADVFNAQGEKDREDYYARKIADVFDCGGISTAQAEKVAKLCAKFESFIKQNNLSLVAVRCWPEFAKGFGISPCAAMSLLGDEGYLLACEGDVDCGLTMLCHAAAGADKPFMADLSQADIVGNSALMWHCGVAPCSLRDGVCKPTLDTYFAAGKGVTAGFVMRSGRVNCVRLDSINGEYRLFIEDGTAVPMQKELTGTYAKVVFDKGMQSVLDKVVYSGIAHHVSMVYGDYARAFEIFARLTKTEVLA